MSFRVLKVNKGERKGEVEGDCLHNRIIFHRLPSPHGDVGQIFVVAESLAVEDSVESRGGSGFDIGLGVVGGARETQLHRLLEALAGGCV